MTKLKSEMIIFKEQLPLPLAVFVYISRAIFLASAVAVPSSAVFSLTALALTYLVSLLHLVSKKDSFLSALSHRITALICFASLISCFIGQTLGVLTKNPDYDIVMSLATGVTGALFGYYLTVSIKSVENKRDCSFIASSSLFVSGTIIFFREMLEFFSDYLFGTNYVHAEQISDDHWFFRLLGVGSNIPQQRPLFDTDEDMLISLLSSAVTTAFLYAFLKIRNKTLFIKEKKLKSSVKALPSKIYDKIYTEIEAVKKDTSIVDTLTWWLTRSAMIYAAITIEDNAERILIIANLLATFAITLLHLIFPKESLFGKINYRLQSWICLIVFTGSYMGNYIFVYNNLPRFDLFLHFISGPIAVAAGYYALKTFKTPETKREVFLAVIYAFCLSCFIIPFWEVFEFIGDFLFGSANQGFYWVPGDDSFFFKLFGRGHENRMLYYLFDTVYDVLLAFLTTVISALWLHISLLKNLKAGKTASEKDKIAATC